MTKRLSLSREEAAALLVAAKFVDAGASGSVPDALHRAQAKLARSYNLPDPYPELDLSRKKAPRAHDSRKQSPELIEKRKEAGRLMGLRRGLRVSMPGLDLAIARKLSDGSLTTGRAIWLIERIKAGEQRLAGRPDDGQHQSQCGYCIYCHAPAPDLAIDPLCYGAIPDDPAMD